MRDWFWWTRGGLGGGGGGGGGTLTTLPPLTVPSGSRRVLAFQPCSRCCDCTTYSIPTGDGELGDVWQQNEGEWTRDDGLIKCTLETLATASVFFTARGSLPYKQKVTIGTSIYLPFHPERYRLLNGDVKWCFIFGADENRDNGYALFVRLDDEFPRDVAAAGCVSSTFRCSLFSYADYAAIADVPWWPSEHPNDPPGLTAIGDKWVMAAYPHTRLQVDLCVREDSTQLHVMVALGTAGTPEIRVKLPALTDYYTGLYAKARGDVVYGVPEPVTYEGGGDLTIYGWSIADIAPEKCPDCTRPCDCLDALPDMVEVELSGVTGENASDWNGIYLCDVKKETLAFHGTDTSVCGLYYRDRDPCSVSYNSPSGTRDIGPIVNFGLMSFSGMVQGPSDHPWDCACTNYDYPVFSVSAVASNGGQIIWNDPHLEWDGLSSSVDFVLPCATSGYAPGVNFAASTVRVRLPA